MAEAILCVECGVCYSDCPAVTASPQFVGPMALAKAYRYAFAPRDEQNIVRLRESLAGEPVIRIPYLDTDVHDIAGLTVINEYLFNGEEARIELATK